MSGNVIADQNLHKISFSKQIDFIFKHVLASLCEHMPTKIHLDPIKTDDVVKNQTFIIFSL
jgi:hypothetical protein